MGDTAAPRGRCQRRGAADYGAGDTRGPPYPLMASPRRPLSRIAPTLIAAIERHLQEQDRPPCCGSTAAGTGRSAAERLCRRTDGRASARIARALAALARSVPAIRRWLRVRMRHGAAHKHARQHSEHRDALLHLYTPSLSTKRAGRPLLPCTDLSGLHPGCSLHSSAAARSRTPAMFPPPCSPARRAARSSSSQTVSCLLRGTMPLLSCPKVGHELTFACC